jgi:hypothetical protein
MCVRMCLYQMLVHVDVHVQQLCIPYRPSKTCHHQVLYAALPTMIAYVTMLLTRALH